MISVAFHFFLCRVGFLCVTGVKIGFQLKTNFFRAAYILTNFSSLHENKNSMESFFVRADLSVVEAAHGKKESTLKEITSHTEYLVSLSSKTCVFEDKLTKY